MHTDLNYGVPDEVAPRIWRPIANPTVLRLVEGTKLKIFNEWISEPFPSCRQLAHKYKVYVVDIRAILRWNCRRNWLQMRSALRKMGSEMPYSFAARHVGSLEIGLLAKHCRLRRNTVKSILKGNQCSPEGFERKACELALRKLREEYGLPRLPPVAASPDLCAEESNLD